MAINLDERYPGRANGKTLNYPQGSFKNRTSPTSKDGTYLEQDWANDQLAFFQSMMKDAGMAANGIVDTAQASQYFDALVKVVANRFPMMVTLAEVATLTVDQGPVMVIDCAEIWTWVATPYFTGYRSPLCGRPLDGHTIAPLASEVDGVGGVLPKAAYARLWGYAQENGLVVSQATWSASVGAYWFVDVDSATFRVPDLRNQFRRFTGTDADTASARAIGTRQGGAIQTHRHNQLSGEFYIVSRTSGGSNGLAAGSQQFFNRQDGTDAGGAETRPTNTAYLPRIHV